MILRSLIPALCAAAALLLNAPAQATTIEGHHFDDAIQLARTPLALNGVGVRGVDFLRAFAAGLYVEKPSNDPTALIDDRGPKRLSLTILMTAPASVFVAAITNGVRKNTTPEEQAAMADRVKTFQDTVSAVGEVRAGDRIDLDYLPRQGLVFSFNGKPRGAAIAGDDLYRAILKMFIGERAVDKKLRQGLLGSARAAASADAASTPGVANAQP